jgi:SAM-dependent methyltransferase
MCAAREPRVDDQIDSLLGIDTAAIESGLDAFSLLRRHGIRFMNRGDLDWHQLATLWRLLDDLHVVRALDLGSGYGRLVFFGAIVCGVDVTGIELVAERVSEANRVCRMLHLQNARFEQGDIGSRRWPPVDCICIMNSVTPAERPHLLRRLHATCAGTDTLIAACSNVNLVLAREPWSEWVAGAATIRVKFDVWRAR